MTKQNINLNRLKDEFKNKIEYLTIDQDIETFAYSIDASTIQRIPSLVLFPKSKEELIEIVKLSSKYNFSITARGSGTNLVGNSLSNEVIVDFSKLNKLLEIDEENKTAVVEPGVICAELNNNLKKTIFPVIPSSHRVCTIGGMINCNSAGNWSMKFGKVEHWIENVWFIDGYGKEVESKEIVGTEGMLGLITKVKLKLTEIPKIKVEYKEFDDVQSMINKMLEYKKNNQTIMLEVLDKNCSNLLLKKEKIILLIGLESNEAVDNCEEYENRIRAREKAYPTLAERGYILIEDPQIPEQNLSEFLEFLEKNNIPYFGHIGSGIIHPCFRKDQKELINKMYLLVKELNGRVSGEHGIGLKKIEFSPKEFTLKIIELKAKYDPNNIFNRELFNSLKQRK